MNIKYKISYLTDGNKVKITSQLFKQINEWENEGIKLSSEFLDELKRQDNEWINSIRQYYRYTVSLQSLSQKAVNKEKSLRKEEIIIKADRRLLFRQVIKWLDSCTSKQRRRFLLFYYYGFSYSEIGKIEGCSVYAVRKMVQKVEKRLLFEKSLL
jgi:RNA polymerase sigma factor (sigma-70 family)